MFSKLPILMFVVLSSQFSLELLAEQPVDQQQLLSGYRLQVFEYKGVVPRTRVRMADPAPSDIALIQEEEVDSVAKSRDEQLDNAASENRSAEVADDGSEDSKSESSEEKKTASATSVLRQARRDLNSFRSIRATLDETISFGSKRFHASGTYLQGGDLKLRLEYELQLGASKGILLEVCDGQVLWTQQTIDKDVQLTRRDVRQILEVARSLPRTDSVMLHTELGLGGIPALLASLEESMEFRLGADETIGERRFSVIEGRWNKEYMKLWTGGSNDPKATLPIYVPDRIRIYLERVSHNDKRVYFPARLVYLKKTDPEKQKYRQLVSLLFNEVVLDGPVDDDEFQFVPGEGLIPVDVTQEYIQQLKPANGKSSSATEEKSAPN